MCTASSVCQYFPKHVSPCQVVKIYIFLCLFFPLTFLFCCHHVLKFVRSHEMSKEWIIYFCFRVNGFHHEFVSFKILSFLFVSVQGILSILFQQLPRHFLLIYLLSMIHFYASGLALYNICILGKYCFGAQILELIDLLQDCRIYC